MYTFVRSVSHRGLECFPIDVEADFSRGLPTFDIVGLGDATIREAKDRIQAAMRNCGYNFPTGKLIVNLAPASTPKTGALLDLPIAIAVMAVSGILPEVSEKLILVGELSVSGALKPVRGVLAKVIYARDHGCEGVIIPSGNAAEAAAIRGISVYPADTLSDVVDHLSSKRLLSPLEPFDFEKLSADYSGLDYSDVRGQDFAKRALEIAAAGGHNLLMIGPPGSGKSMLAKRFPSILPELSFEEALEVAGIRSVCDKLSPVAVISKTRPFRSPHHNASPSSLVGGGAVPNPGEISLAHNGVLFLDEIAEFPGHVLESLRQPLEDKIVTISRVSYSASFPCRFQLLAAMNPCRCGYFGHPTRRCSCSTASVESYLQKISGPLLDRFDLHVEVAPVEYTDLAGGESAEPSAEIRKRVLAARELQQARFDSLTGITCNAAITSEHLRSVCSMSSEAHKQLERAFNAYSFSARIYDRVIKVARTIADLDSSETITGDHISEAVQYRILERKYWKN